MINKIFSFIGMATIASGVAYILVALTVYFYDEYIKQDEKQITSCEQCYLPYNQIYERQEGDKNPIVFVNPACLCNGSVIDLQFLFVENEKQRIITYPVADEFYTKENSSSRCDITVPYQGEKVAILRYYGKSGCIKEN